MNLESKNAIDYFTAEYAGFHRTYPALPSLDDYDRETDVLEIVARNKHTPINVLRFTRWHLMQCLNGWAGIAIDLVMPNPGNPYLYTELDGVTDERKQAAIKHLEWMGRVNREVQELQFIEDDDKTASFVIATWGEWMERREYILNEIRARKERWYEHEKATRR